MAEVDRKPDISELEDSGEVNIEAQKLSGFWKKVAFAVGVAASIFHLWANTIGVMPEIERNAVHFGFMFFLVYLFYPGFKKKPKLDQVLNVTFGLLAVVAAVYILLFEEELHLERGSVPIMRDYVFAVIAVIVLIIGAWRASGWIVPVLGITFISYALFLGKFIPGAYHYRGVSLTRLLYRLYLTDEGIFGTICSVSSTYVYLFILFGAFLLRSGGGDFMINLANALTGHRPGGPAKIAVISSGFMGSVSGSAVANVVATGSITIPMMKSIGFRPAFAGAVEAAASTGGGLMPPIMGAGAFIMAQWTGISYLHIIAVSAIPACLYYLGVYYFVHLEALKMGIQTTDKSKLPKVWDVLKDGMAFLIPVVLLVGLLLRGFTPTYAACIGIFSIVAVSWFRKKTRMGFKDILDTLYLGARNAVSTSTILICAGIVIAITGITGIGVTFSSMVIDLSGGSMFLAIVLICLASLVLGMGLPVTASYIFLAVLAGPALQQMGMSLLAAHMIIFWYSQDANVTPPVCLAAYSAAGIAGANSMETGLIAWKLAKGLYIIPLLFAYSPILFEGPVIEVIWTSVSAALGLYAFAGTFENYLLRRLTWWERLILGVSALALYWPHYLASVFGLIGLAAIYVPQKMAARKGLLRRTQESSL